MKSSPSRTTVIALVLIINAISVGAFWFRSCESQQNDLGFSQEFRGTAEKEVSAAAATANHSCRPAKLVRVIDGDTVECAILLATTADIGCDLTIKTSCRLYGINAPDTKPDGPEKTKAATEHLKQFIAANCKDGQFSAELKGRDKYGRILIEVLSNGVNLNQKMIEDGFAEVYLP